MAAAVNGHIWAEAAIRDLTLEWRFSWGGRPDKAILQLAQRRSQFSLMFEGFFLEKQRNHEFGGCGAPNRMKVRTFGACK